MRTPIVFVTACLLALLASISVPASTIAQEVLGRPASDDSPPLSAHSAATDSGLAVSPDIQPKDVNSVKPFIDCLNQQIGGKKATIADTTQCIAPGSVCFLTVTMSSQSLQPACTLPTARFPNPKLPPTNFPRVVLSCPGPANNLRFRPSYNLCPNRLTTETLDDVEFGLDNAQLNLGASPPTGTLLMADLKVGRNEVFPKAASVDRVMSHVMLGSNDGTKMCNTGACHGAGGAVLGKDTQDPGLQAAAKDVNLQLSKPISPFGKDTKGDDLVPFLIFTNDPDGPKKGVNKQSLPMVCACIEKNADEIAKTQIGKDFMKKDAPIFVGADNTNLSLQLCKNLVTQLGMTVLDKSACK